MESQIWPSYLNKQALKASFGLGRPCPLLSGTPVKVDRLTIPFLRRQENSSGKPFFVLPLRQFAPVQGGTCVRKAVVFILGLPMSIPFIWRQEQVRQAIVFLPTLGLPNIFAPRQALSNPSRAPTKLLEASESRKHSTSCCGRPGHTSSASSCERATHPC